MERRFRRRRNLKEDEKFVDLELPKPGDRLYIEEVYKFIENRKGAMKMRSGNYIVVDEYPSGFLCILIGPNKEIEQHQIREFFRKDDFKKGLLITENI